MKTITIKQPWASLVVEPSLVIPGKGIKDIENRTWKCPEKYIGTRILVHSSAKGQTGNVFTDEQFEFLQSINHHPEVINSQKDSSSILGSVEIVGCVINHESIWAEKTPQDDPGNFIFHKPIYNWILANPIKFETPITGVKGKLSFWDYDLREIGFNDHQVCLHKYGF